MLKKALYLFILTAIIFSSMPVSAKILLKPNGSDAMTVITRSISADVTIDGQFATTTQTLVFQNENDYQMEADFIYTLPPGAVATYFAYWAGEEKVVARIVEKEEAKKIYNQITTWNRDPALVEMIGKNTFRARIFPVFANEDLKIELRYVSVLPSDKNAAVYALALPGQDQPDPLDDIDIKVHIKPNADISNISNNYGLPVTSDNQGYQFNLSGENYRPLKDLNIRLNYKKKPMQTSLYSAYSGGSDGFFALSLTPDHSLTNPKIKISGVKTYDVAPALPKSLKAGSTATILGRYKGSGEATIALQGQSPTEPQTYCSSVQFRSIAEPENLATKLWAAQKIETLGKSSRNRSAIIALSKRFTLPSKYTSWLAVPKEEMKNYKRGEYADKIDKTAKPLADLIIAGKESDPQARKLQDQLTALCNKCGSTLQEELANYLCDAEYKAATNAARLKISGRNSDPETEKAMAQLQVLCKYSGGNPDDLVKQRTPYAMGEWLTDMIAEGKADDPAVKKQLNDLSNGPYRYCFSDYLDSRTSELADTLVKEQHKAKQDQALVSKLQEQVKNLEQKTGNESGKSIDAAYQRLYKQQSSEISEKLADLICSSKGSGAEAMKLRQELSSVCSRIKPGSNSWDNYPPDYWLQSSLHGRHSDLLYKLIDFIAEGKSKSTEGIRLNRAYANLSKELKRSPKELHQAIYWRMNDLANQIAEARHSNKPEKEQIAVLHKKLQRLRYASGISAKNCLHNAEAIEKNQDADSILQNMVDMISSGQANTKAYQQQKQRYTTLARQLGSELNYNLQEHLNWRMDDIARDLIDNKYSSNPDPEQMSKLQNQLKRIEKAAGHTAEKYIKENEEQALPDGIYELQELLDAELYRDKPNPSRLQRLRKQFKAYYSQCEHEQPKHYLLPSFKDFDGIVDDAISARLQLMDVSKEIETAKARQDDKTLAGLEKRKATVERNYNELYDKLERATYRWGDPLIAIEAPADTQQVIALMPDGEIKVLTYNSDSKRWEARFDIPSYAGEGGYVINIVIVLKDGTRKILTMSYKCDLTAPKGDAKVQMVSSDHKLRLELDADDDTARAAALLPWGERIELSKSNEPNKFFAIASVPVAWHGKAVAVQFVLTDGAHNRTSIVLDMAAK